MDRFTLRWKLVGKNEGLEHSTETESWGKNDGNTGKSVRDRQGNETIRKCKH